MEDIENNETVAFLKNAIKEFPEPSRITFELIKTEMVSDYKTVIAFMESFKKLGINMAIDDFGSGYSNFAYLVQFKADILKIDGTLIKEMPTDANSFQVVAAISDFARRLGMKTVAEFVSDRDVDEYVRELEIDFAQGYHYGKPISADMLPKIEVETTDNI